MDKLIKRMVGWRFWLLAYNSRLVLIKSRLASILVYLMSFLKFPKWAIRLIESQMSNCLWNDEAEAHRYHLANWRLVTMKKEFGGLGPCCNTPCYGSPNLSLITVINGLVMPYALELINSESSQREF
jgi:hypothetical protein